MAVVAKLKCTHIVDNPQYENKTVHFSAVISGSEENKSFSKYTPSANLSMVISYDTQASGYFEEGKEYYVNFTKSD